MMRELKGWHVLAITISAFGIIITVNLMMAFNAVSSFPGLEVPNSYVASQSFDRQRAAQERLGWTVNAEYDGQKMRIEVVDAQGHHPMMGNFTATVGRPTHKRADVTPEFRNEGGVFIAPVALDPGIWIVHISATALDGTEFRQRLDHYNGSRVN